MSESDPKPTQPATEFAAPVTAVTRDLKFDERGLITAVAQDRLTGTVRMVAWMNRQALEQSVDSGQATFFSRSRNALWTKGETSGNTLAVRDIVRDCDGDTLLLLVDPTGPSCHTGQASCFFTRMSGDLDVASRTDPGDAARGGSRVALPFLFELEDTLRDRQERSSEQSYTRSLLDAGPSKIASKLSEEAGELGVALERESDERVLNEAADVLYHLLVGLRFRELDLARVIEVLAGRSGRSGHEEKASRKPGAAV